MATELTPYGDCEPVPFLCIECNDALAVCDDNCVRCLTKFYVEHPEEFDAQVEIGSNIFALPHWKTVFKGVQDARAMHNAIDEVTK